MEVERLLVYYYEMLYEFTSKQFELEEMPGRNQLELYKLSGMIPLVCDFIDKLKKMEEIFNETLSSETV